MGLPRSAGEAKIRLLREPDEQGGPTLNEIADKIVRARCVCVLPVRRRTEHWSNHGRMMRDRFVTRDAG
jgi:hypothetical protein